MKTISRHLVLSLTLTLLFACTGTVKTDETVLPNITPPIASFVKAEGNNLTISKEALGKPFLLQASSIPQSDYASAVSSWSGIQSQIVLFQQKGEDLFLMRSPDGQTVTDELPTQLILAKLPVTSKTENQITVDFNDGMSKIFVNWDWYVADYYGTEIQPQYALPINNSFIDKVENKETRIRIDQVGQIFDPSSAIASSIKVVYYLSVYNPDPSFEPVLSPGFDKIGYFEVSPIIEVDYGFTKVHISKWNHKKSIVFHYSANTPKEFEDAIKEGVLYWNKAFGKEVVKIEKAPEGVMAPDPDYNMIQWATFHDADWAYADAQMDPLTGEILHAQIFIPTVFTRIIDSIRFPRWHRKYKKPGAKLEEETGKEKRTGMGLKGFQGQRLCEWNVLEEMEESGKIPEDRALEFAQNFLRNTMAHEVGHTLGLRHNFAGSTYNSFSIKDVDKIFGEYVQSGIGPEKNIETSSSVMDYNVSTERIISGYLIKHGEKAFDYDRFAIEWAYLDSSTEPDGTLAFCTDSQVGLHNDCLRGDEGSNPFEALSYTVDQRIQHLDQWFAEMILDYKVDWNPQLRKPISEVVISPQEAAYYIAEPFYRMLLWLDISSQSIADRDSSTSAWIEEKLKEAGGIEQVFSVLKKHDFDRRFANFQKNLSDYIQDASYRKGKRWDGEAYEVTEDEIRYIEKMSKGWIQAVQTELVATLTFILTRHNEYLGQYRELGDYTAWENTLSEWARYVLLSRKKGNVALFPKEIRHLAVDVLDPQLGPVVDWEMEQRGIIAKEFEEQLQSILQTPLAEIDINQLPREQRQWIMEELEILNRL